MDTPNTSDRLTRVETLLEISLQNQAGSKERMHGLANDLHTISARLDQIGRSLDEVKDLKVEVKELKTEAITRLDEIDEGKAKLATIWHVIKWLAGVAGGAFTLAITLGDKLAPLIGALFK